MKKRVIQNILLLFFSIIFCLLLIESILKIPDLSKPKIVETEQGSPFSFVNDTELMWGWTPIPNFQDHRMGENGYFIRRIHNSWGLRSTREFDFDTNKTRIILLGDSFIYGNGLDQNETLDYFLQKRLGDNYEVLNLGVIGYSTLQSYFNLLTPGIEFKPDIVIFSFYINDMNDNMDPYRRPGFLENGQMAYYPNVKPPENSRFIRFLKRSSKIFQLFEKKFLSKRDCNLRQDNDIVYFYRDVHDVKMENIFSINCHILQQFHNLSIKENFDFYVLYIPNKFEIYEKTYEDTLAQCTAKVKVDIENVKNRIEECTSGNDMGFIDLIPLYKENIDEQLYNKYGGHWSPFTTNMVAKHIAEKVMDEQI